MSQQKFPKGANSIPESCEARGGTTRQTLKKLMTMRDLQAEYGRSRPWFYGKLRDDPTFPRPVKLGSSNVAWFRSEIESWFENLPRYQPTGLSAVERRQMAKQAREAA